MRPSFLRYFIATLAIAATVALIHGPWIAATWSTMTWEDPMWFEYVAREIRTPLDCFTAPPLWPGLYRPLTTGCYYAAGVALFGQHIEPFHAVTVAMYVANGVLLFALARRLLPQAHWLWALAPALLWVSRRAHVETVTLAVEFQSLFAVFCSLLALLVFIGNRDKQVVEPQREESPRPRHAPQTASSTSSHVARAGNAITARTILTVLLLILALISKESAVILPAILLAHAWTFHRLLTRRDWIPHLLFFTISAAWAVLFFTLFRATSSYEPTGFGYADTLLDSLRIALRNLTAHFIDFSNLLVSPVALRENIILVPTVARWSLVGWVQGLVGAILLAATAVSLALGWRTSTIFQDLRLAAFGLAFFLLAIVPFLFFDDRLFMRYSYFSHAGLALAAGALLHWTAQRVRPISTVWLPRQKSA